MVLADIAIADKVLGQADFEISFRDSQDFHAFEEKVSRVRASLESNLSTVSSLYKKLRHLESLYQGRQMQNEATNTQGSAERLLLYLRQTESKEKLVSSLIGRCEGIAVLVSFEQCYGTFKVCCKYQTNLLCAFFAYKPRPFSSIEFMSFEIQKHSMDWVAK